jgi:hypothetical protein
MSFFPGNDPASGDPFSCEALELLLVPRSVHHLSLIGVSAIRTIGLMTRIMNSITRVGNSS